MAFHSHFLGWATSSLLNTSSSFGAPKTLNTPTAAAVCVAALVERALRRCGGSKLRGGGAAGWPVFVLSAHEVLSRIQPKPRRFEPAFRVNLSREGGNTHGFLYPSRVLYGFPHGAKILRGFGWIRDCTSLTAPTKPSLALFVALTPPLLCPDVVATEFLSLPEELLGLLMARPDITCTEEKVFEALLYWMRHDVSAATHILPSLPAAVCEISVRASFYCTDSMHRAAMCTQVTRQSGGVPAHELTTSWES